MTKDPNKMKIKPPHTYTEAENAAMRHAHVTSIAKTAPRKDNSSATGK